VPEGILDDLEAHLEAAGSLERAAVPLGMYLAWCANLQLVSGQFQVAHEGVILRLRYRELTPAEFFTATTGGTLALDALSPGGQAFSQAYYPDFPADLRRLFGSDPYSVQDDWPHYDQIAAVLTRHYMAWKDRGRTRASGRRGWWRRWRDRHRS